jgi:hypothetical protein
MLYLNEKTSEEYIKLQKDIKRIHNWYIDHVKYILDEYVDSRHCATSPRTVGDPIDLKLAELCALTDLRKVLAAYYGEEALIRWGILPI